MPRDTINISNNEFSMIDTFYCITESVITKLKAISPCFRSQFALRGSIKHFTTTLVNNVTSVFFCGTPLTHVVWRYTMAQARNKH